MSAEQNQRYRSPEHKENLTAQLMHLGLTMHQASAYLALLNRRTSVRGLAEKLSIHRAEAYRILKELKNLGLVEEDLGRPVLFSAVTPEVMVHILLARLQEKLQHLTNVGNELLNNLRSLEKSRPEFSVQNRSESRFILIHGRSLVYRRLNEMISRASQEVLRTATANQLKRNFMAKLYRQEKKCVARGVPVRLIAEIEESNVDEAEKYARIVDMRTHPDVVKCGRLLLVDEREALIGASYVDDLSLTAKHDFVLWTDNAEITQPLKYFFEIVWRSSQNAQEAIRTIRLKKNKDGHQAQTCLSQL